MILRNKLLKTPIHFPVRHLAAAGLVLPLSVLAIPALADVKSGVDAWTRGDFPSAIREWQGPAEKGDADAQFNLAQAYKLGRGVPQDLTRAEVLFAKAAAQGHVQAGDNYGLLLFQRGQHAQAMPYIKAASDRGDPRAQYLLGIAHFNGDSVPKDWVRAYALASLSQQAGLPQAKAALAQMDRFIPLDQRQRGIALASELGTQAETNRAQTATAMDLGSATPAVAAAPRPAATAPMPASTPPRASPPLASAAPARPSMGLPQVYTPPRAPSPAYTPPPAYSPAPAYTPAPAYQPAPPPAYAPPRPMTS